MARLVLRTFGGLSVERDERPIVELAGQRRALGLLAAVAAAGSRGLTRDRAMLLLWPESSTERARGSLKQLLHHVRQLLGDDALVGVAELRLDPATIESDVAHFRDALETGDDEAAVRLYRGPFLDGVHLNEAAEFEQWAAEERTRLAFQHAEALERLARRSDEEGRKSDAVSWWRQLHALDPLNARATLGLARALDAAGDRAGAIRIADNYPSLAEQEAIPPDPEVLALADQLRQRRPLLRPSPTEHAAPPQTTTTVEPRPSTQRRTWFALAVVGCAIVAIVLFLWLRPPPNSDAVLDPSRVAIAVFVNRTGDPQLDALGTMASDWVTRGLAHNPRVDVIDVGGLYVAGRDRAGAPADPRTLARTTGAGLVVAGNYYLSGDSLMFSARVIDIESGRVLRALDPIGGRKDNALAIIEEVRHRTTAALGTILDPRASVFATTSMVPPRLDAFEAFVKGQEIYWQGDWAGSLPWFRTAAALDTSFTLALTFLSVIGVGTAQCGLADSVLAVLESRPNVAEMDLLIARISVARCASDHAEHNRLHRMRAALAPKSKFIQMTMSTGFRQMNQPAEALAILAGIEPARDLGWLPVRGRTFYWREVAANQHALGEFRAEVRTAERMTRFEGAPLAVAMFRARGFAAQSNVDSALAVLDGIAEMAPDPALLSGITGALNPVELAVPGWVMFQTALELAAHGHAEAARSAIDRSIAWYKRTAPAGPLSITRTIMVARAYAFAGDFARARDLLAGTVATNASSVDAHGLYGQVASWTGDHETAAAMDAWLARQTGVFPPGLPTYYRATLAALRGDKDRAFALLAALPSRAHPHDFLQFHVDPALAPLRDDQRFRQLLTPKG